MRHQPLRRRDELVEGSGHPDLRGAAHDRAVRSTGAVLACTAVRFTADMNSFPLKKKQMSAVATMP
jgi:hypothetical protein